MSNIGDFLGVRKPTPHNFSKATPLACPDAQLLYGVELEIERAHSEWSVPGMDVKEDGSLRDGGLEFITQPMTYSNLSHCLSLFFKKVNDPSYSERCSVHVHTNVSDLTFEQLSTVTLIYQTFENVLFSFIGNDRDKNIFCVPWSQTTLTHDIINKIKSGNAAKLKHWQKYTALNLLTMFRLGTIEWRHMSGTDNLERILLWCRIIGRVFAWARKNKFEDTKNLLLGLNTTSHYRGALFEIFQDEAQALQVLGFEQLLEDGVLQLKYAMLNTKTEAKKQSVMHFDEALANEQILRTDRYVAEERAWTARFNGANPFEELLMARHAAQAAPLTAQEIEEEARAMARIEADRLRALAAQVIIRT